MKNIIFTSILLLLSLTFKAQKKIPYEKLDSISAVISQYQSKSENLSYNDGKDTYKLSFPDNNFKFFFSTGKATKAVNKTKGDDDFLFLTENIDLTKASEIYNTLYAGSAGAYRLVFSEPVKTQIYKNGEYIETKEENYLEFFFPRERIHREENGSFSYEGTREIVSLRATVAFIKLENNLPANLFIYGSGINYKKYGSKIVNDYEKYFEDTFTDYIKLRIKSTNIRYALNNTKNPAYLQNKIEAAEYYEAASKTNVPKVISSYDSVVDNLLGSLREAKKFTRMEEILQSPDAYFLDLSYPDFIGYKADYMIGTGKCIEGEKLLLDNYNSPESSKELKEAMRSRLYYLYRFEGCKGEGGNKVKKDSKQAKKYDI